MDHTSKGEQPLLKESVGFSAVKTERNFLCYWNMGIASSFLLPVYVEAVGSFHFCYSQNRHLLSSAFDITFVKVHKSLLCGAFVFPGLAWLT